MTQHDPAVVLQHMLDYARRARSLALGRTLEELESDELLSLAVPRALEIVGEAASRMSVEDRARYPDIDWRRIIDFRNVLIHGYEQIDFTIIHEVLNEDVPRLIANVEAALSIDAEAEAEE